MKIEIEEETEEIEEIEETEETGDQNSDATIVTEEVISHVIALNPLGTLSMQILVVLVLLTLEVNPEEERIEIGDIDILLVIETMIVVIAEIIEMETGIGRGDHMIPDMTEVITEIETVIMITEEDPLPLVILPTEIER